MLRDSDIEKLRSEAMEDMRIEEERRKEREKQVRVGDGQHRCTMSSMCDFRSVRTLAGTGYDTATNSRFKGAHFFVVQGGLREGEQHGPMWQRGLARVVIERPVILLVSTRRWRTTATTRLFSQTKRIRGGLKNLVPQLVLCKAKP